MNRTIIFYEDYFIKFYEKLDIKTRQKIQYVLEIIKQVPIIPERFLKKIQGYDDIYEIRIEHVSNTYRIFCCIDKDSLVILFNGFQKKSQKTPIKEIEMSVKLKNEYFKLKEKIK